ncbi:MAG TPA: hypothetical protein VGJ84_01940 [Polyangiaceae bacterium]|jgi:predicted NBD/HSP70 family sugar kinase
MKPMILDQRPRVAADLEPGFRPAALENRAFRGAVSQSGGVPLELALERDQEQISVYRTSVFAENDARNSLNLAYVERLLKFLIWQRGAWRVWVSGPERIFEHVRGAYRPGGARAFEAAFFCKVYEKPAFVVEHVQPGTLPAENERGHRVGGNLDGCRIGFDAGGSDRKVAAVIDGKEVFSCEVVWNPKTASDPQYHFDGIDDSIRRASEHLPRIDGIGVSSAGIYIDNRTRVASLFRAVPAELFDAKIKTLYLDIAKKWAAVPIQVANDGDVTALAGALELNDQPVLGIAMGTSQAAGYVNAEGLLTGWLNELAFAPIDYSEQAPLDEWSGDRGGGVSYFSQEAVIRLAPRAGVELPEGATPAEKLAQVQALFDAGDERPRAIFQTIGVFLGYGLIHYADFYHLKHVLLLGRVTSGQGGSLILERANQVLSAEAPQLCEELHLHLPNEATRRVGQAIAAASLPRIG